MENKNLLQAIFDGVKNVKNTSNVNEITKKKLTELPTDVKGSKKKLSTFYKKFWYFYLTSKYENPESLDNKDKQTYFQKDMVTPQYIKMILFICIRRDYNLNEGELKLFYKGNDLYVVQIHNSITRALRFSESKEKEAV